MGDIIKRNAALGTLLTAIAVGYALSAPQAFSADSGGGLDLEERIAELEALTARKGNRKVGLTIAGQVAHQLTFWDDGQESNAYVTGAGSPTHIRAVGSAHLAPGWTAGYNLHLEFFGRQRYWVSQDDPNPAGPEMAVLRSFWFVQSDKFGKLSIGKLSQASDDAPILVDASGSAGPANFVVHDGSGFFLLEDGNRIGARWGDIAFCHHIGGGFGGDCNGATTNAIRYDTPSFGGGFVLSATWGGDDFWDAAVNYAREISDFKVLGVAAYSHTNDSQGRAESRDSGYLQLGGYIEHMPTGLFGYAAYAVEWNDHLTSGGNAIPTGTLGYYKAGLRRKWFPLGHSILYGEYSVADDMMSERLIDAGATGSSFTRIGAGIVQEIDNASMSVWLKYRQNTGDISNFNGGPGDADLDRLHFVGTGAIIRF